MRKTRSVLRAQKTVVEQKPTKGAARLGFCGTRAARMGGELLPFVMCRFFAFTPQI